MKPSEIINKINAYERLMRLDKPIGILLLLWPTLWALWLAADGHPHWIFVGTFSLGTILMRSAGCVVNDVADRNLITIIQKDPYQYPPEFEYLKGDMQGLISRRINKQHRLVYEVIEKDRTIKIYRMWSHYE